MDKASEELWHEAAAENGWVMPTAPAWKRLPVIRWFRAVYHNWQAHRMAQDFASVGIGLGFINEYDAWVIYGIATGKERPPHRTGG